MGTCFVGHSKIVAALRAARFPPHSKLWGTQRDFSWIQAIEFVEDVKSINKGEGGYNEDHEYFGELANI